MCGIVGAWSKAAAPPALSTAVRALAHRGPDGAGEYHDAATGVLLGHVRLAILDLSPAGAQPMASADDQVVLVFNGEIYNFRELRDGLERDGVIFRGHSDTEVLLELYLRDGLAMLPMLNGIFAFAIHDRRSARLWLVRDGMGIKPLYYQSGADGFAFASEIKALLPLMPGPLQLDPAALHRYLSFLWCPGEQTPVLEIRKLLPGHALEIAEGRIVRNWAWFELPARRGVTGSMGCRESIAAVEAGLRTAVHRQLVSDVPVGAFLSGGLDSSAIVAFAREQVPDLRCFTIESAGGGEQGETEDLPYARQVAAHLRVPLDIVTIDPARMARDLQAMVVQLDEPLADPAPLNVLYISRLAREQGIKVLLSGAGGDDLFTGYRRHLALRYEGFWNWLPPALLRSVARGAARLDQRSAFGRRARRLFANVGQGADERLCGYLAWAEEPFLRTLYTPELARSLKDVRASEPMLQFLQGIPPGPTPIERLLALEQRFFLADHNLNYTDKMSMATGVEVRVPFLDSDLVEIAARIPDRYKQRRSEGKWVLKQAMEPYLPRDVIYRPKSGFGAPLRRWMRNDLRELLGDLLSETSLQRRGLFQPSAVQQLIAHNDAGRVDASYTLLSLLCLEIWCRHFIDGCRQDTGYDHS